MSMQDPRARCHRGLYFVLPFPLLIGLYFALTGGAGEDARPAAGPAAAAPALIVEHFDNAPEQKTAWGSLRWLMSNKVDPKSNITLGVAVLNPGQSNPLHIHDNCEEVIYILSGSCEQRVGEQTVLMKAGDSLHVPAGVSHTARALGNEPLRSVVAYNSGDRHFRAVDGK